MRRTPDSVSRKRQEISARRSQWLKQADDVGSKPCLTLEERAHATKQAAFCRKEAEKCTSALLKLKHGTTSQVRAGWTKDNQR